MLPVRMLYGVYSPIKTEGNWNPVYAANQTNKVVCASARMLVHVINQTLSLHGQVVVTQATK